MSRTMKPFAELTCADQSNAIEQDAINIIFLVILFIILYTQYYEYGRLCQAKMEA